MVRNLFFTIVRKLVDQRFELVNYAKSYSVCVLLSDIVKSLIQDLLSLYLHESLSNLFHN